MKSKSVSSLCLNMPMLIDPTFSKKTKIKGIYVWGYEDEHQNFIPVYVGKSRNIFERILQHYVRFGRGEYAVPEWLQKQCGFSPSENYVPKCFQDVFFFNTAPNNAMITAEYIIKNFRFLYLETSDGNIFEKYLADKIGRNKLITSVPKSNVGDTFENPLRQNVDDLFNSIFRQ